MLIETNHYSEIIDGTINLDDCPYLKLTDHLDGFDAEHNNALLNFLSQVGYPNKIYVTQPVDSRWNKKWPNLNISFSAGLQDEFYLYHFHQYKKHPKINYKNFVCSFNGTSHISRRLLVANLARRGWFNPAYSSKNFSCTLDNMYGHIADLVGDRERFYNKFFIGPESEEFFNTVYTFDYVRYAHHNNIYTLENKLTESFVHIVSESMATSYMPFITEKFLYSIVTRGLFLGYAAPGWHHCLEQNYGFKLYRNIFDYSFDSIQNPAERLVALTDELSKFSNLTPVEWNDLRQLESENIEYNYQHYFSHGYITHSKQYEIFD